MLLTIDLGNTHLTAGIFDGETLACEVRLATDRLRTEDQYAVDLASVLALHRLNAQEIDGAIMCSVVPGLDTVVQAAVNRVTGITPLLIGPGTKTGVNIHIDDPSQLGSDLLVGTVAAAQKYGKPCVVWDLGTATTVSVLDETGTFRGGAIMPGVNTSLESLVSHASLLPRIRIEAPDRVVGTNTDLCMRSGLVYGTASMIDGMTARIAAELGQPVVTVITGGLGQKIAECCQTETVYDSRLLLDGLRLIYEKNHGK